MNQTDIQKIESILEDSFLEYSPLPVGGSTKEKIRLNVTGTNHDYNEIYDEARRIARKIKESIGIELKIITVVSNWEGPLYTNLHVSDLK